jgi:hypothetical protein
MSLSARCVVSQAGGLWREQFAAFSAIAWSDAKHALPSVPIEMRHLPESKFVKGGEGSISEPGYADGFHR